MTRTIGSQNTKYFAYPRTQIQDMSFTLMSQRIRRQGNSRCAILSVDEKRLVAEPKAAVVPAQGLAGYRGRAVGRAGGYPDVAIPMPCDQNKGES